MLTNGLRSLAIDNPDIVAERLTLFAERLISANRHTSLVAADSVDDLVVRHFLDSLAPLKGLALKDPVVDVGSGAGMPGLVAAVAYPTHQFVLLEPRRKRVEFLRGAVVALGVCNTDVVKARAETAARAEWRGRAGTVLLRAVARPVVAFEYGLPLLRIGGKLVLYTGRQAEPGFEELAVINLLGGRLIQASRVEVPHQTAARHVWVVEKVGRTPPELPRCSRVPARSPLGLANCST